MELITRIHFRRLGRPVWEDVLSHTRVVEIEIDEAKALHTVLQLLRRFRRDHADAWFHVRVVEPCLLRVERTPERPTNPVTGKPCRIRVDPHRPVNESGVVEVLAQIAGSFHEAVSRKAFRAHLVEQFTAHVLRHRRDLRGLGLDHADMVALAQGLFQSSEDELEAQALRALGG